MIDWKLGNEEETVKKNPCQVSGLGKWEDEDAISETGNTTDRAVWQVRGWREYYFKLGNAAVETVIEISK